MSKLGYVLGLIYFVPLELWRALILPQRELGKEIAERRDRIRNPHKYRGK